MPQMDDPHFKQSLVYLMDHDEHGAFGVVINQPYDMALGEVFRQLDIESSNTDRKSESVLRGGPVDQEHGLVLHRPGPSFDSTKEFSGGVAVSSSRDVLEALAVGEDPQDALVLLGHAGWAPQQLEMEVANNAWLTCEADTRVLFDTPLEARHTTVAGLIGIDWQSVVGQSGHA